MLSAPNARSSTASGTESDLETPTAPAAAANSGNRSASSATTTCITPPPLAATRHGPRPLAYWASSISRAASPHVAAVEASPSRTQVTLTAAADATARPATSATRSSPACAASPAAHREPSRVHSTWIPLLTTTASVPRPLSLPCAGRCRWRAARAPCCCSGEPSPVGLDGLTLPRPTDSTGRAAGLGSRRHDYGGGRDGVRLLRTGVRPGRRRPGAARLRTAPPPRQPRAVGPRRGVRLQVRLGVGAPLSAAVLAHVVAGGVPLVRGGADVTRPPRVGDLQHHGTCQPPGPLRGAGGDAGQPLKREVRARDRPRVVEHGDVRLRYPRDGAVEGHVGRVHP